MEKYKELTELRKKYNMKYIDYRETDVGKTSLYYPASNIMLLFNDSLSERDKYWLLYENEIFINRRHTILPHSVLFGLKNYVFLGEKDVSLYHLLSDLYHIADYNPMLSLMPFSKLPDGTRQYALKKYHILKKIEELLGAYLVGEYNNETFSFCVYNLINKFHAKIFLENNCRVLFCKVNRSICLYFDPIYFENEDLDKIGEKIKRKLGVNCVVDYDYDNYSISFIGEYYPIEIFNIINENEKYAINLQDSQSRNVVSINANRNITNDKLKLKRKYSDKFHK